MSAPNPLAFEFAKLLRHREFRDRLKACGWQNGMTVYAALPGETDEQVKTRMEPGRHLLVVEDASQPYGLRMIVCEIDH